MYSKPMYFIDYNNGEGMLPTVGLETPQKTSGEATAGVALQGVKEAVCKNSGSVQEASTCRNRRSEG